MISRQTIGGVCLHPARFVLSVAVCVISRQTIGGVSLHPARIVLPVAVCVNSRQTIGGVGLHPARIVLPVAVCVISRQTIGGCRSPSSKDCLTCSCLCEHQADRGHGYQSPDSKDCLYLCLPLMKQLPQCIVQVFHIFHPQGMHQVNKVH